jgi:hypothetical protein
MTHLRLALIVFGATVAGVGALAAIVATTGRALPYHFPRAADACFGRVYGAAFLAAHPEHRVSELYARERRDCDAGDHDPGTSSALSNAAARSGVHAAAAEAISAVSSIDVGDAHGSMETFE